MFLYVRKQTCIGYTDYAPNMLVYKATVYSECHVNTVDFISISDFDLSLHEVSLHLDLKVNTYSQSNV